jgi:hypothetical protein|tara:strand:- start:69 stop:230 length:162 start_codon:yes stop_codon:yes gene_type:complete
MLVKDITESVCERCKANNKNTNYIIRMGHCPHVYKRAKDKYVYYEDSIEEDEK